MIYTLKLMLTTDLLTPKVIVSLPRGPLVTICIKIGSFILIHDDYCVSKEGSHLMFDNNFGKCGPIFTIVSPTDS